LLACLNINWQRCSVKPATHLMTRRSSQKGSF
jgi:hypothetical protein